MNWDFVKNAVVEDINTVPESLRGLYVKNAEGKFAIADSAKSIVEMYVGTNTSLVKARTDLAAANKESAERRINGKAVVDFVKSLGVENINEENPLETLQTHITDLTTKVKGGGDLKVNLENIKKDYERKNKELSDAAAAQVVAMQTSLEKHLIGNQVLTALSKHGGNATLLTPLVKSSAKVVKDENGEYSVRIIGEDGSPRSNGAGGWLDLEGFVGELKTKSEYAAAFASDSKGGTGHKSGSSNQQVAPKKDGEKSPVDKITAGLAKGQFTKAGQGAVA